MQISHLVFSLLLVSAGTLYVSCDLENRRPTRAGRKGPSIYTDDFEEFLLNSDAFVDKSGLISELCRMKSGSLLVINRPSGYGKSLNLDMVRRFFSLSVNENGTVIPHQQTENYKLFAGGQISDKNRILRPLRVFSDENATSKYFGEFPVIYFDFNDVDGTKLMEYHVSVGYKLIDFFRGYKYLQSYLSGEEAQDLDEFIKGEIGLDQVKYFLRFLCQMLYNYFGEKVFILIDNFDSPIRNAFAHCIRSGDFNLMNGVIEFLENIYAFAFKRNPFLEKGILTGVSPFAMNNFFHTIPKAKVLTMLDEELSQYFGFSEAETRTLLRECEMETAYSGGQLLYNPYRVANAIESGTGIGHYREDFGELDGIFASDEMQPSIRDLVAGPSVNSVLQRNASLQEVRTAKNAFYSALVYGGYLNAVPAGENQYALTIPNGLEQTYCAKLEKWICSQLNVSNYGGFVHLLVTGKVDAFTAELLQYLKKSSHFFPLYTASNLYAFMSAVLLPLGARYTIVAKNGVSGGRYSHFLVPKSGGNVAILVEYKKPNMDINLNDPPATVLDQVIGRFYDEEIRRHGYTDNCLKVVIALRHGELVSVSSM